jgi:hypothetical protein
MAPKSCAKVSGLAPQAVKTREHILELDISPFMKALRKKDI